MRLIDADELLTAFPADDEPTVTKSCVCMTIQRMPTVDATPVRWGRWVKRPKNAIGYDCTACGKSAVSNNFDYCPNCGADMRGEQL